MTVSMMVDVTVKKRRNGAFALFLAFSAMCAPAAFAEINISNEAALPELSQPIVEPVSHLTAQFYAQNMISASRAKAIARSRVPGSKYVDMSRNGNVYRVRVKKDGRIIDVLIDATTGRVLN